MVNIGLLAYPLHGGRETRELGPKKCRTLGGAHRGFRKNLYCKNLYRKNLYRPTSLTTTVHSSQIAMAFASPSASAPRSDATGSPSTEHSALDDAKSRLKFGARYESLQDIVKDVEFIRSGEVRSAWPVL